MNALILAAAVVATNAPSAYMRDEPPRKTVRVIHESQPPAEAMKKAQAAYLAWLEKQNRDVLPTMPEHARRVKFVREFLRKSTNTVTVVVGG